MGTKKHGQGTHVLLNHVVLDAAISQVAHNHSRQVINALTLDGNEKHPGQHDAQVQWNGFGVFGADDVEEEWQAAYAAGSASDNLLQIFGGAAGDIGRLAVGSIADMPLGVPSGELITMGGTVEAKDTYRVIGLESQATVTGTGGRTGQNYGAIAVDRRWAAYVALTAVTTFTTATVRVEQSSDNAAGDPYAHVTGLTVTAGGSASAGSDVATFTGPGWALFTGTVALEAWLRLNFTVFTGTSAVVTAAYGQFAKNN